MEVKSEGKHVSLKVNCLQGDFLLKLILNFYEN